MDLTANLIAQTRRTNQFHFDAEAFDRAILRAERRRAGLRRLGARLAGGFAAWAANPVSTAKMASRDRPA